MMDSPGVLYSSGCVVISGTSDLAHRLRTSGIGCPMREEDAVIISDCECIWAMPRLINPKWSVTRPGGPGVAGNGESELGVLMAQVWMDSSTLHRERIVAYTELKRDWIVKLSPKLGFDFFIYESDVTEHAIHCCHVVPTGNDKNNTFRDLEMLQRLSHSIRKQLMLIYVYPEGSEEYAQATQKEKGNINSIVDVMGEKFLVRKYFVSKMTGKTMNTG